jgi:hypothetical protein
VSAARHSSNKAGQPNHRPNLNRLCQQCTNFPAHQPISPSANQQVSQPTSKDTVMKDATGFTAFVPGFDFIKNLSQQASGSANAASGAASAMPGMAAWVAPTFDVEELDKRINELKSVQFWLEQNSRALTATIQALEVQKMTLATLKGMDVGMDEVTKAMQVNPADLWAAWQGGAAAPTPASAQAAPAPQPPEPPLAQSGATPSSGAGGDAASATVDPTQWWASVSQQFQDIAANAMQDISKAAAQANTLAEQALKPATKTAATKKAATKTAATKKPSAKKASTTAAASRKTVGRASAAKKPVAKSSTARARRA